eukprot:g25.t1
MTSVERASVAYLEVLDSGNRELDFMQADGNCYKVQLLDKFPQIFTIYSVHTHMLTPYPTEITQGEPQLVLLELDAYFNSAYSTDKMTTVVELYSNQVESWSRHKPSKRKDKKVQYGPYLDVEPHAEAPVLIHFQNDHPFVTFTHVDKEIEVSHWGNIAVEELIDMEHTGAKLKGGFSRLDYMRGQLDNSFDRIVATLPLSASDLYYRDVIGNISTSDVTMVDEGLELMLLPRFPMYGGWKTQFYYGYNLPSEDYVSENNGNYVLDIELPPAFDSAVTNSLRTKIILPEGATDIEVVTPYDFDGPTYTRRFTFLDASWLGGGRPVIILKKKNIVREHYQSVQIKYKFRKISMLGEPLLLILGWLSLFLVVIIGSRLDFSIVAEKAKINVGDQLSPRSARGMKKKLM